MAKQYNPKDVLCLVDGEIIEGYGTDTFIECSMAEDKNTLTISNDSEGTFNKNPNHSGTIKLTLMHNSDSVEILNLLTLVNVPYAISIYDKNMISGKALAYGCMLKKKPDLVRAKEVGTIEFEYICEKLVLY